MNFNVLVILYFRVISLVNGLKFHLRVFMVLVGNLKSVHL